MESHIIRPGYLTAHQTAQALGVGLPAVRKLVQRGELTVAPGSTPRHRWFAIADVQAYDARRATRNAA
ncbi:hypothetical protein [Streptomyces luteocolor]|uniref:hypothetical protein n=1 Tax=Streptomyces luteocolor TaxID=285500 RepID=UPI00085339F7|nr:hypothetical protein [Streptomyces luteocolor]